MYHKEGSAVRPVTDVLGQKDSHLARMGLVAETVTRGELESGCVVALLGCAED